MKVHAEYQKGNEQSDYKDGALTLYATDLDSAFALGRLISSLISDGKPVVHGGGNGSGVFIRIPLVDSV